jgi:phenylalanyl-tRNA synthetase alpha chain
MVEASNPAASEDHVVSSILQHLAAHSLIEDTLAYAAQLGLPHTELDKSLKSLLVDDYLTLTVLERKLLELTDEGAQYATKGTPEYQYAAALPFNEAIDKARAEELVGKEIAKIGFAKAMQRKWIALEGDKKDVVRRIAEVMEDQERE